MSARGGKEGRGKKEIGRGKEEIEERSIGGIWRERRDSNDSKLMEGEVFFLL